jgi:hypothetical protein
LFLAVSSNARSALKQRLAHIRQRPRAPASPCSTRHQRFPSLLLVRRRLLLLCIVARAERGARVKGHEAQAGLASLGHGLYEGVPSIQPRLPCLVSVLVPIDLRHLAVVAVVYIIIVVLV